MARQSFKFFTPRDKPKKRGPRHHKKSQNKQEKRQKKQKRTFWLVEKKQRNDTIKR